MRKTFMTGILVRGRGKGARRGWGQTSDRGEHLTLGRKKAWWREGSILSTLQGGSKKILEDGGRNLKVKSRRSKASCDIKGKKKKKACLSLPASSRPWQAEILVQTQ